MDEIPLGFLITALAFLIVMSGFFSGSETALMTLNRYRLRHLANEGNRGALRASRLLDRPDRLIGLILLGNNFVNILASSIATVIALRLWGEAGIAIAAGLLTFVILIFAEVAPKTLAALHPERVAFPASLLLAPLLTLLYPLVWIVNMIANGLLKLLGVSPEDATTMSLSQEELRTVVTEAGAMIPRRHQRMLLNILDLEKVTVEDIMVPRGEIVGIDIEDPIENIVAQIQSSQHTRLPIYRGNVDDAIGLVHVRNTLELLYEKRLTIDALLEVARDPYFVPEGTPLNTQLMKFQREKRRIGLVVDEYGEIQGLVTMEDILEEIVGEFTTDPSARYRDVRPQPDGTFLVDGSANIRELNRMLSWELPTSGPKTLNGLILEQLEAIPEPGTSILIAGHPVEIIQTSGNAVKTAKLYPSISEDIQPG